MKRRGFLGFLPAFCFPPLVQIRKKKNTAVPEGVSFYYKKRSTCNRSIAVISLSFQEDYNVWHSLDSYCGPEISYGDFMSAPPIVDGNKVTKIINGECFTLVGGNLHEQ